MLKYEDLYNTVEVISHFINNLSIKNLQGQEVEKEHHKILHSQTQSTKFLSRGTNT
jgi:hypothetical protein